MSKTMEGVILEVMKTNYSLLAGKYLSFSELFDCTRSNFRKSSKLFTSQRFDIALANLTGNKKVKCLRTNKNIYYRLITNEVSIIEDE